MHKLHFPPRFVFLVGLIGLERIGGIMVYNISNPLYPRFVKYATARDFSGDAEAGTAGDLAPEGLVFIAPDESPNGEALLIAANEVSGSISIFFFGVPAQAALRLQPDTGFTAGTLEAATEHPASFALRGNYPNPFNPVTTFAFDLPAAARVTLKTAPSPLRPMR